MEDSEVLEMISNQQLINALWRTYEEANNILNHACLYHIRPNPTHVLIAALNMLLKRWIYRKGNTTEERLREQLFVKQIYQHYNNQKLPDMEMVAVTAADTVSSMEDTIELVILVDEACALTSELTEALLSWLEKWVVELTEGAVVAVLVSWTVTVDLTVELLIKTELEELCGIPWFCTLPLDMRVCVLTEGTVVEVLM